MAQAAPAPEKRSRSRSGRGAQTGGAAPTVAPLRPLPRWIRQQSQRDLNVADAAFAAGATLAALDAVVRADPPWHGVWAQRLALRAAAACWSRTGGRGGEEASLRDAHSLARPGDDPGPAGRILRAWRHLAERSVRFDPASLSAVAAGFGILSSDAALAQLADHLPRGPGDRPAIMAAADAAAAVTQALGAEAEFLGLWVADAVLAQNLGWAQPLPLLSFGLRDPALRTRVPGRRPRPGDPAWTAACCWGYASAAAHAHDLACDLERRARDLQAIAPRLRAKQAPQVVAALLADDALAASSRLAGMTDRSLRRLLDRLVALGGARELTGRATSRLYGL